MKSRFNYFLTISFSVLFFAACSEDNNEPVNQGPNLDEVLFYDGFESGNLKETNEDGFDWLGQNRTSIVTQSETDGNVVVLTGGGDQVYNVVNDDRDWTAFDGENSMRFRYPAGEAMSEQRFDLGSAYPELWFSYWLRVPVNFSYGPTGSPNKFFALWSDGYEGSGDGSTVWLGFHRTNVSDATISMTYSNGSYSGSNEYQQAKPFITTNDRGRWMHMVMHFKTESTPGTSDGVFQTYRRWDGEPVYTKLHEAVNLPLKIPTSGPNGFKSGYILGWANAAYSVNTEWLLDDFIVSETSLLFEQ